MTELSDKTIGSEATAEVGRMSGIRLGRLLIGALAALSIQAATGVLPGIGSSAFAAGNDGAVPSIEFEPVYCDRDQVQSYTPIIKAHDATLGVLDSQYVYFQLDVQKLVGDAWQPAADTKPYGSGALVVTDSPGDVTVPALHILASPGTGTYRVQTTVWWSTTWTPNAIRPTSWLGSTTGFGHHLEAGVAYFPIDPTQGSCLIRDASAWVADKGGPTISYEKAYCDDQQIQTYAPPIVANDATPGAIDYQQVVYQLELQKLVNPDLGTWQTVPNVASYVSPRFVVNDGTGIVKDVFLPNMRTFNIPDLGTMATYRVLTSVWWTQAQTTPNFDGNVSWSRSQLVGLHYRNTGLSYALSESVGVAVPAGSACSHNPPLAPVITS